MIVSFSDKVTEDVFHGRSTAKTRRFAKELQEAALIKLDMLNAASKVDDLKSPPGNRLELLKGDLQDNYSIRINDQWRLVFRFRDAAAFEVRIADYH